MFYFHVCITHAYVCITHTYVCMYVCMFVYMVVMYVSMFVCMYLYMYVRMYVSQICLYVCMDMNNDYHHHLCVSIIIIIHLGTPTKLSPLYAGAVFPRSAKTITTTIPSIDVDDDDNGSDDDDDDVVGGVDHDDHDDGAIMGMSIIDDYNNTGNSDENYVDRRMIVRNDDGIGFDDNISRDRGQWVRTVGDGVVDNSTSITTTTATSSSTSTLLSSINDELNYITLMERYADAQNHRLIILLMRDSNCYIYHHLNSHVLITQTLDLYNSLYLNLSIISINLFLSILLNMYLFSALLDIYKTMKDNGVREV